MLAFKKIQDDCTEQLEIHLANFSLNRRKCLKNRANTLYVYALYIVSHYIIDCAYNYIHKITSSFY